MSGMQKIIYSMVLTVMYGVAMERQPVQSHKEDDNRNSQQRALANSFIGSLPSELTRSLTPLFSTPAPDQRTMSALGEIRSRDNRSDAIIEANKNLKSFEQLQRELYGDNPAAEDAGKRKFLDAQMAFLASHPKEQSFYPPNNVSAAVALDTQSVSTFLAKEIEQKIESFKQLPQEEKNKTAIAYMRHFPLPEIMGKLLDEGVEVDAHDPQTKFTLVRYAVEAKSPALLGLLLTQRASPDMADCRLISPLMRAASLGNIELAKLLLEKNCTVHAIDAKGRSALCFAARKGDLEMVTLLQLNGAHVFDTDESYKNNALVQAVKGGSPAVLKKIIDGCSNPQGSLRVAFEVFVNLALKKAAKMGDDAMVTELLPSDISHQLDLKRNPKPDIILDTEKRHETALSLAVEFGHCAVALKLLAYALERYYKGLPHILYSRSYALAMAVHNKAKDRPNARLYQQVIDTLLEEEVDPLQTTYCSSAAFLAAKNGDSLLLKQLIDHSALKKYVEKYKNSADQTIDKKRLRNIERYYASKLLLDAAQAGVPKAIKLLLDYGARIMVDGRGNTPLHKAVVVADKHTIEMIRDLCFYQRATISQGNDDGDTPLHVVLKNPDVRIKEYVVKILSEYGADPNACNRKGDTPLINAVQIDSPLIGVINAILKALANKKIKPNTQNNKGETALICAAAKGKSHIAVVEKLLEAQGDPNVKNNSGCGALTKAARNGLIDMTKMLSEYGARLDDFKDGMLREAAKGGHVGYMNLLLAKKPDLNSHSSSMGDTPLHKAVQREKIEAVKFLLTKGADQSVKNFKGETPLECAVTIGNQKIIDLLLLHH